MFAQRPLDRRRFFGTVALSMAAAWIGTRDSVLQCLTTDGLAGVVRTKSWLIRSSGPRFPTD